MKVIIGLGNPGEEYERTRHNVGFMFVEKVAKELEFPEFLLKKKLSAYLSETVLNGDKVILVKSDTYMNKSGEAVLAVKNFYKINDEDIIMVYDDYDLPIGTVRYRENGSAGTHNGMKSCVESLGTENFKRLRIGINAGLPVEDLSGYVLGRVTPEEMAKLRASFDEAFLKLKDLLAI
ncbi:MAG: hypothetical protein ACD_51C00079G0002 [uncultured bacterium]|nr:MAG: hypothetical protein ACD_51C00079G0002 [uncultured bacterium]KKT02824.1 MAG: peptidyl-tRNA hydrolase, peptidyl-tRNA hydrolase, PTH1 family [Candidatus Peregrinibacteria bacterium GW2011_GWF2_43_17]KKT20432.1 MAG: Peptidyl-tRNA hydrolase [Candidatus Peregrinibacteria bacterium GW2011_GWA2_43_8]HAU39668.1 aminoacyl-tRNA hydrolase [Candidatus Peregrinibacteria bacterium]